jgi:hypothetical protein
MAYPNATCLNLILDWWILFFRVVARLLALGFCALAVLLKGAVSFFTNYNK